jgi:NAD+ kinase
MAVVALVLHRERDLAATLAADAAAWLLERGHEVRVPDVDAALAGLEAHAMPEQQIGVGIDLAISLGGDGTILRTIDLVSGCGAPVLGVNVGQLGYLTEIEPPGFMAALEGFLEGRHEIEERMLLSVALDAPSRGEVPEPQTALNEAVLEKTPLGHTVRLRVLVDGEFFTPYAADGLIVATPTGSTAYSFSARGPIVAPEHKALVLTPVSPHMLFDRSLILGPDAVIRLEVCGHRPATLSVDGRNLGELQEGDAIECTSAPHPARLVSFGERDFLGILKAKFGLTDR